MSRSAYFKELREARIAEGVCAECGREDVQRFRRCVKCRLRTVERVQKHRRLQMPHQAHMSDPEMKRKLAEGKRKAALYRITDPLWFAIHMNRTQEVARLQAQLAALLELDRERREA